MMDQNKDIKHVVKLSSTEDLYPELSSAEDPYSERKARTKNTVPITKTTR